jgi:hypothetical protein
MAVLAVANVAKVLPRLEKCIVRNAAKIFQWQMDLSMMGLDFVFVYLDNVISVAAPWASICGMCGSFPSCYRRLALSPTGRSVCLSCERWNFWAIVSGAGVSPLAAINDHPRPTTVKELQGSTFTARLIPLPPASFADQLKSGPKS